MRSVDAHYIEHLRVHDVEAAASVHQHFCESLWADDWVDYQWTPSQVRDSVRMVGSIEGYGRLRPSEEGRRGRRGRIDLTACDLLAALGVIGR